jgi:hypothetical protein
MGPTVRKSRSRKSPWQNAIWITRAAIVLGVIAVGVEIESPGLFQTSKVIGFLAIATMSLSVCAISMSFWKIQRHSHRWRQPIFWFSLLLNLVIIGAVGLFYLRGSHLPSFRHVVPPDAPDANN